MVLCRLLRIYYCFCCCCCCYCYIMSFIMAFPYMYVMHFDHIPLRVYEGMYRIWQVKVQGEKNPWCKKMEAERMKLGRGKILSRSGEVLCEGGVWGSRLRWDESEAAALTDSLRERLSCSRIPQGWPGHLLFAFILRPLTSLPWPQTFCLFHDWLLHLLFWDWVLVWAWPWAHDPLPSGSTASLYHILFCFVFLIFHTVLC